MTFQNPLGAVTEDVRTFALTSGRIHGEAVHHLTKLEHMTVLYGTSCVSHDLIIETLSRSLPSLTHFHHNKNKNKNKQTMQTQTNKPCKQKQTNHANKKSHNARECACVWTKIRCEGHERHLRTKYKVTYIHTYIHVVLTNLTLAYKTKQYNTLHPGSQGNTFSR